MGATLHSVRPQGPRSGRVVYGTGTPKVRFEPRTRVVLLDKTGMGKSTAAKALADRALEQGWAVIAFDPHDEYSRWGRSSDEVELGPLDDRCTVAELAERPARLREEGLSLAVVPRLLPRECAEDFGTVVRLVAETGDCVLVVDEVGYFGAHAQDWLNACATQSRHWLVPLVLVAQRATQVPKTARTQASDLVTFRQENDDDLAALAADYGGSDFASDVPRLGRGEFKHWRDTPPPSASSRKEK